MISLINIIQMLVKRYVWMLEQCIKRLKVAPIPALTFVLLQTSSNIINCISISYVMEG